ncbi:hypothetical protein [Brevundimonas sp. Root1279]|uniref:hypothetical protein n=1 Tax=Brevundimonas sp. Root1279 TaxID=1736443 RepID=UPI000B11E23B|nr:hypothetical protein [Brevundimonas sp. Root1279]
MSAAAPWSVKGIEPRAREIAKDLARRSGMTLGEWLNSMIMEDGTEEEGVVPLTRRPHASDSYERRTRSRRLDDAYGPGEDLLHRLAASIDAIAGRLEAAERRSTVAIQGVDQAVSGIVRRLDDQDQNGRTSGRRLDDMAEELREGHRRLRKFENEVGPQTLETFGKIDTSLGTLAGRLYDIEERQRTGINDLRQRMESIEKAAGPGAGSELLAQVGQRLDAAQTRTTEALRSLERSFAGLDQRLRAAESRVEPEGAREAARFEKLAETLSRSVEANRAEMIRRLDTAETEGRMDRIERALLTIGESVKASEERSAKAVEAMGREVLRIAENLNNRVGAIETEAPARFEQLSRQVESDMGRFAQGIEQRMVAADDRHALALEKLGGEITRISDRLSERIAESERRSALALEDIGRRLADSSNRAEQRYDRASGELAERMRMSEERTAALIAEARDSIGRRAEPSAPAAPAPAPAPVQPDWRAAAFPDTAFPDGPFIDPVFDDPEFAAQQAWSADLAPPDPEPRVFAPEPAPASGSASGPVSGEVLTPDAVFDAVMRGRGAPGPDAPFGSRVEPVAEAAAPPPQVFAPPGQPAPLSTPLSVQQPIQTPAGFGQGFGGADVSDALAATAPEAFDGDHDDFAGETDFVDQRALRAAAAQGRASSTRQAIDAARAAMSPNEEPPARTGFGLKRGGKSALQERLDKQAKNGDTVRKALGASSVAILLTAGGAFAFGELTGVDVGAMVDGEVMAQPIAGQPIAALAVTDAQPVDQGRAGDLYRQAVAKFDGADPAGVVLLKEAVELGHPAAQRYLSSLYETGDFGVKPDAAESARLLRLSAEGGDPLGMHTYGLDLYAGADGLPADKVQGLAWLLKAAEVGVTDSQYNVAVVYERGSDGIPADPVEAFKWYLIAARAGDAEAQAGVDRLRATLPAADRTKARAAAGKFTVEPLA